jgi:hypothetical protein
MFAKRRANVRNLGFCTFYKLCAKGKENAIKSRPSQTFFRCVSGSNDRKTTVSNL